jgi:hypothetical protein
VERQREGDLEIQLASSPRARVDVSKAAQGLGEIADGVFVREASSAANAFLPAFLRDFNARFTRIPTEAAPAWRRAPRDLALVLSCRYTRRIARDNTVHLGPRWLQQSRFHASARPRPAHGSGSTRRPRDKLYPYPKTAIRTPRGAPPVAQGHCQKGPGPLPRTGMTFSCCSYHDIFMLQRQAGVARTYPWPRGRGESRAYFGRAYALHPL